MKLNGFVGKGTGKLGSSVFAVSGGEQIVRQYNPNVSNPSTDAQVAQRAKLKLMSQIAAALALSIAFSKQGLKSARNLFIKRNFSLATYLDGEASVDFTKLHITDGNLMAPNIAKGTGQTLSVINGVAGVYDVVQYAFCKIGVDEKIQVLAVRSVTDDAAGIFSVNYSDLNGVQFVYAFAAKFNSASAKTNYGNYEAAMNGDGAYLDVTVAGSLSGATKTDTKYIDVTGA